MINQLVNKKTWSRAVGIFVASICLGLPASAADQMEGSVPDFETRGLRKYEPMGEGVYHGANLPETSSQSGLQVQTQRFETVSGKKVAIIGWYANLYNDGTITLPHTGIANQLQLVKEAGSTSLIQFSTADSRFDETKKAGDPRHIVAGVWDDYFKGLAQTIKEFGSPVFISLDKEMNGTWYPYSEAFPESSTTAADYIAMWRHIVDIFRAAGATNVAWVWTPNAQDVGPVPFANYYPGDDYVDWVGVSFYSSNQVTELDKIYRAYSQRKPIFIVEWATSPTKSRFNPKYTSDAAWVNQVFQALETRYRRIKAITWFEWDSPSEGNYLLEREPKQQAVYKIHISRTRYLGEAKNLLQPEIEATQPEKAAEAG